jgi:hypothetical protein
MGLLMVTPVIPSGDVVAVVCCNPFAYVVSLRCAALLWGLRCSEVVVVLKRAVRAFYDGLRCRPQTKGAGYLRLGSALLSFVRRCDRRKVCKSFSDAGARCHCTVGVGGVSLLLLSLMMGLGCSSATVLVMSCSGNGP